MARTIFSDSMIFERVVLPLFIALVFLLIPDKAFADIERLYAEDYSASVEITLIGRLELSPLVGVSQGFKRIRMTDRWPLWITIGVIVSVLLYMEILVRRQRALKTKSAHPGRASHLSGEEGRSKTTENGPSRVQERAVIAAGKQ